MKKIFTIVISFVMLCMSFPYGSVSAVDIAEQSLNGMTIEQFVDNYVAESVAEYNKRSKPRISSEYEVKFRDIEYNSSNRTISFVVSVSDGTITKDVPLAGVLYSGRKQIHGINSIVGRLKDLTGTFEVLHFEIYNDNDTSYLDGVINSNYIDGKMVKLYLRCGNKLYLCESEIPREFIDINIPYSDTTKATDSTIDGFWFTGFLTPEMSQQESEKEVTNRGYTENTWQIGYLADYKTILGTQYNYYTKPTLFYRVADVNSSDSTWETKLTIADEYCIVDGIKYDGLSGIRIKNYKVSAATDTYTRMLSYNVQYDMYNSSANVPNSLSILLGTVVDSTGSLLLSTAIDIINLLNSTLNSKTVANGITYLIGPEGNGNGQGRGCRLSFTNNYFLQDKNQYVQCQYKVTASSFGQPNPIGGQKTARMVFSFDWDVGGTSNTSSINNQNIIVAYNCSHA